MHALLGHQAFFEHPLAPVMTMQVLDKPERRPLPLGGNARHRGGDPGMQRLAPRSYHLYQPAL